MGYDSIRVMLRFDNSNRMQNRTTPVVNFYNDKDSFVSQLFIAQILTNMIYHNLDFKDLRVYISDAITEYDTINTLFLRVKQNKLVAKRVLEIDREKKAA